MNSYLTMNFLTLLLFLVGIYGCSALICPGGDVTCSDSMTCCRIYTGGFGCCPFPNADCCPDLKHCCKEGYSCATGECVPRSLPLAVIDPKPNVLCPDLTSTCPGDSTCCLVGPNIYACCPLPNAVCCPDHAHCCPSGTTCDLVHQTCVSQISETTKYRIIPGGLLKSNQELNTVDCGDGESCPDGSTCCKLPNDDWGCCPLPGAVCCPDKIHCCPNGAVCTESTCKFAKDSTPWFKQVPTSRVLTRAEPSSNNVICPGGEYQCPDLNTCCKLASGDWGCCPLPNATCCPDGEHCCPQGSTCAAGRCYTKKSFSVPWSKKFKATPKLKH